LAIVNIQLIETQMVIALKVFNKCLFIRKYLLHCNNLFIVADLWHLSAFWY